MNESRAGGVLFIAVYVVAVIVHIVTAYWRPGWARDRRQQ